MRGKCFRAAFVDTRVPGEFAYGGHLRKAVDIPDSRYEIELDV